MGLVRQNVPEAVIYQNLRKIILCIKSLSERMLFLFMVIFLHSRPGGNVPQFHDANEKQICLVEQMLFRRKAGKNSKTGSYLLKPSEGNVRP